MFLLLNTVIIVLRALLKDKSTTPPWITVALAIWFIICVLLLTVGGFMWIGQQNNAHGFKEHVKIFFIGFWHEAKIPLLLAIIGLGAIVIVGFINSHL